MSSRTSELDSPKASGDAIEVKIVKVVAELEYVGDRTATWHDARTSTLLEPQRSLPFYGIVIVEPGVPVEIKWCQIETSNGNRSTHGRFYVKQAAHEQLLEAAGMYLLVVYLPRPGLPQVARAIVHCNDRRRTPGRPLVRRRRFAFRRGGCETRVDARNRSRAVSIPRLRWVIVDEGGRSRSGHRYLHVLTKVGVTTRTVGPHPDRPGRSVGPDSRCVHGRAVLADENGPVQCVSVFHGSIGGLSRHSRRPYPPRCGWLPHTTDRCWSRGR